MRVISGLPLQPPGTECALTIGAFDGVHLGHQALIARTLARARESGWECAVLTFEPHPVEVLAPQVGLRYLSGSAEREQLIAAAGADVLYVVPFTAQMASTPAREFVRPLLELLGMRAMVIGYDFTLGYKRQGNSEFLRQLGAEWGFSVDVLAALNVDGGIVSSTRIRKLLAEGALSEATRLLGHRPSLAGTLTADLSLHCDPRRQTLPDGSYGGFAGLAGVPPTTACTIQMQAGIPVLLSEPALYELGGHEVWLEFAAAAAHGTFEEVEHTADVALRVQAPSFEELLRSAAEGMGALMADPESVALDTQQQLTVRGEDDESLLVNWLNELLYQHEMTGKVLREFDLTLGSEHTLEATARGGIAGTYRKQIKAATFHDLHVAHQDGRWDATIVFDI